MRRSGEDDEVKAVDFELIDTGCVDTDGNKVVLIQRATGPIGYVRFAKAFD